MTQMLLSNTVAVAILMLLTWMISLLRRDAGVVDSIWGLGFVIIAWTTWWNTPPSQRSLVLPILTTIWGLRLSVYLTWRNWRKPEDFRYRAMREKHGDRFGMVSLLTVFGLQGVVMWIVALPIQTAAFPTSSFRELLPIGCLLWATGFLFETVGDWQLATFKRDPSNKGMVMDRGLWRYTRHPNYFGDFCVWWGLFLIAFGCGAPLWSVVGPALMSMLLLRVSGVTLLERTLIESKPGYAEYVAKTSAFFPRPPARST